MYANCDALAVLPLKGGGSVSNPNPRSCFNPTNTTNTLVLSDGELHFENRRW
jgi:hypothetical protein